VRVLVLVKSLTPGVEVSLGVEWSRSHRLDEDEIQPRHWFTCTGLTNGRHSKPHTTLTFSASLASSTAAS
jgi:hypothetical protein